MYRIGLHIYPSAPFWIEVDEAIRQRLGDDVVTVDLQDPYATLSEHEEIIQAEEILAYELDAFIGVGMQRRVLELLLDAGIPVIYLIEFLDVRHPLYTCPIGLYEAGRLAATYLAGRLGWPWLHPGRRRLYSCQPARQRQPHGGHQGWPEIVSRHYAAAFRDLLALRRCLRPSAR